MNNFIDFAALETSKMSKPFAREPAEPKKKGDFVVAFPGLSVRRPAWGIKVIQPGTLELPGSNDIPAKGKGGFRVSEITGEIIIKRGKERVSSKGNKKQSKMRKFVAREKVQDFIRNVIIGSMVDGITQTKEQKTKFAAEKKRMKRPN